MFFKKSRYEFIPTDIRSGEDVWLSENMGWRRDFGLMIQHTREPLTLVDFFKKERVRGKGDWSRVRWAAFLFPITAPALSFHKFKFLGVKRRAQNIVLAYAYLLGRLTA